MNLLKQVKIVTPTEKLRFVARKTKTKIEMTNFEVERKVYSLIKLQQKDGCGN